MELSDVTYALDVAYDNARQLSLETDNEYTVNWARETAEIIKRQLDKIRA